MKTRPALKALSGRDEKIAGPANLAPADESAAASKKAIAAKLKPGTLAKATAGAGYSASRAENTER